MSVPPMTKPEIVSGTLVDSRYIIQMMLGDKGDLDGLTWHMIPVVLMNLAS